MSRITAAAATSHTLSVTAMEEASRLGQHKVDIDHMLLALVVSEQVAGSRSRSWRSAPSTASTSSPHCQLSQPCTWPALSTSPASTTGDMVLNTDCTTR